MMNTSTPLPLLKSEEGEREREKRIERGEKVIKKEEKKEEREKEKRRKEIKVDDNSY